MPSIFNKDNHQLSKPSSLIGSITRISYGNGVDALPILVSSARGRARKSPRGSTTTRFDSTIISMSSSSSSCTPDSPLSYHPPTGISKLVLQPHNYTAFFFQADRDSDERPSIPTTVDPRETPLPSIPFSDGTDTPPAILVNGVDYSEVNTLTQGITYDAILASTLHKDLGVREGMKYLGIPATRTAPNSPGEGGFSSLTSVSKAMMEGCISLPCT